MSYNIRSLNCTSCLKSGFFMSMDTQHQTQENNQEVTTIWDRFNERQPKRETDISSLKMTIIVSLVPTI